MIKSLKYHVVIPTAQKTYDFQREFKFERGLTGIIGKNESAKSLSLEMIRYGLFGTAALRGPVSDYKKLDVDLCFTVKGKDYIVYRGKKDLLQTIDGALATGTKAVNAKIIEILGYGLDVFDIANNCNQGQVEALGDMKPAERKRMVDQTIGLNVLDKITQDFNQDALVLKRQIEAIEPLLVKPIEPVEPEGYVVSTSLRDLLDNTILPLERERVQIEGWLSHPVSAPVKPTAPAAPAVSHTLEQVQKHQADRQENINKLSVLRLERQRLETTEVTSDQLDALEKQLHDWNLWQQKSSLLARGENVCPACDHHWPLAAAELKQFEHVCEVEKPVFTQQQINKYRSLIANAERAEELDVKIELLEVVVNGQRDMSGELEQLRQHQAALTQHTKALEQYEVQMKAYNEYQTEVTTKQARLEELSDVPDKLAKVNAMLPACITYESQFKSYATSLYAYETNVANLEKMKAQHEDLTRAKKALVALKAKVKTYLVPSLNRVASILLNQMTGGERSSVQIDEEFNILIDGQPINTLSGSGKAVANLAVRIGLGQVLTNKVFSLFMADEVDAAMDEDRAAYTAQCLRRLTDTISQVVLVTHKRPATDHLFELSR